MGERQARTRVSGLKSVPSWGGEKQKLDLAGRALRRVHVISLRHISQIKLFFRSKKSAPYLMWIVGECLSIWGTIVGKRVIG